ncbi:MAG: Ribonuclease J2 (endoribonuclease in RNA processing) [uncultured Thermoleophilia bacterium]|uniref:Ribonuclease J2 (Endoribonuclease in RNA processing) n=1 Tax=uncultured Thermoleophilia bacterium TaxID=1497501 RepID=A0A6J4TRP7_9ACTN|nr:MAG: Ribonuclease J2 (endoribonuclease in RNA processing) [uncultured Thermoleophilia bacterium]
MAGTLQIMPIGGLGEVGRNMTLVSWGAEHVVVDCGVGFPRGSDRGGGIEQLLPDAEVVDRRPIAAVLLTHGHDDHIAALPHLIRSGAPIGRIVTLPFTAALVRAKIGEIEDLPLPPIVTVQPGQVVTTGAFGVEFVRVAHSIPDAAALILSTPVGRVVFSGDYKLDTTQDNPRRRADRKRLGAVGRDGVLALLGDSTNAPKSGRTGSEESTVQPIADVVADAPGRVILSSFASNVDRVDHAFRAADATRRQVTVLGRSMRRNVEIADRLDEMRLPARPTIPPRGLSGARPRGSLVVCTGSQAEQFSVLARAGRGEHPHLHVSGHDTVVFATRPVPGNEPAVEELQASLRARGARIVTHLDAPIHVSGHARADEVEELIDLLRPRFVIPVHGESDMQEAHARIAVARGGLGRSDVVLARNGDVIELTRDAATIVEHRTVRVIAADGDGRVIDEP